MWRFPWNGPNPFEPGLVSPLRASVRTHAICGSCGRSQTSLGITVSRLTPLLSGCLVKASATTVVKAALSLLSTLPVPVFHGEPALQHFAEHKEMPIALGTASMAGIFSHLPPCTEALANTAQFQFPFQFNGEGIEIVLVFDWLSPYGATSGESLLAMPVVAEASSSLVLHRSAARLVHHGRREASRSSWRASEQYRRSVG